MASLPRCTRSSSWSELEDVDLRESINTWMGIWMYLDDLFVFFDINVGSYRIYLETNTYTRYMMIHGFSCFVIVRDLEEMG